MLKFFKNQHNNYDFNLTTYVYEILHISVFLSGFGPRGGKTAICNLVGGHGSLNITLTIHKAASSKGGRE